jgi:hypothetical protein
MKQWNNNFSKIDSFAVGLIYLFYLLVIMFFVIGYFMNIINLIHSPVLNNIAILRIIGVFMGPVGGIEGWLL